MSMKNVKKIFAAILAMAMVMMMSVTAFASGETTPEGGDSGAATPTYEGTITVEKTNKDQVYTLYKLFDASIIEGRQDGGAGISYTLMSGKTDLGTGTTWFELDNGNVTAKTGADVSTADFRTWAKGYGKPNATTLTGNGSDLQWTGLTPGYYFITTTTGSLITVTSITPDVTVQDKNVPTEVDKTITGVTENAGTITTEKDAALAEIGATVSYESRISIASGASNYKFTDVMSDGLTLDDAGVKVYLTEKGAAVASGTAEATGYGTKTAANAEGDAADITITFDNEWLKANTGKDIVIQYSGKVNDKAVVADAGNPNKAKIEYGNTDKPITDEDTATVYTAKLTVSKKDGNGAALAGAGFVLQDKTSQKYYSYTEQGGVAWVDSIDNATEYTTEVKDGKAEVVFKGLDGGTYTLIEKTVPSGYNKADDQDVTIAAATEANATSASNTEKTAEVTNKAGAELPETGGMGTTIFYMIGSVLILGAGVVMITRRRMSF
ncbi:MAG: isopeptide-forming domain-containing fimbrial protein [Sarcina sp.]|nr:isopeptide-forming domain-containing fimbrial protein [Sarcina sp.]